MDLDRSWQIIDTQRLALADLLDGLTESRLATGSLCESWTVRDVGAHLSLAADSTMADVLRGAVAARGNMDRAIRDVTLHRAASRTTAEVTADLRRIVGSRRLAPTTMWRDPLLDILVHSQDITRPLGIDHPLPLDGARVAADWAWRRRFPFWPQRRLRGIRLVATDVDWRAGTGAEVRGPITELLLLSTGRTDAARL